MEEKEPLLESNKQKNSAGFKAMSCIIANASFEKAATFGLSANMILYLENEYHMDLVTGTNIITLWTAASNFLPVLGAFLADSTVGRYPMIAFGSIVGILGTILLWLTTVIPQARPPPCGDSTTHCNSSTSFQVIFLCFTLGLTSVGAGGIRSASMAFGADQFVKRYNKEEKHLGWQVGFGIPAVFMLFGAVSYFSASSSYVRSKDRSTFITSFFQVIIASYKNRHFTSATLHNIVYHRQKDSAFVVPSEKLRFLNNACIVRDRERYCNANGDIQDSWSLCTVDQVEESKAVLKVIPLWLTGVLMSVTVSQGGILIVQTMSMDRHITSNFEIPAASLGVFFCIFAMSTVVLYDRVFVPFASRIIGQPFYSTSKLKMGIGILLSILFMAVLAVIEYIRRGIAIRQGIADNPEVIVNMSALWLILPYCLIGIGEAINTVGQYEFFYSEFPKSMSSIASTLRDLSVSGGGLVATFMLNIIDQVTRRGGKPSWISSNINQGHYDYFYLVIAGMCVVNMLYYFLCSWAYGPCQSAAAMKVSREEDGICHGSCS
ncbi:Proton-dependent oligopeptide transporter family [Heracleum sosnowskyi]|uniref:Proton-dependent oligopeptide transporter family n=1 Tax=Heracleum sosnowskyi TaxID=360622 RepID=A0AAD8HJP5_9APIA|nr:Proton-dependent oligopeptide transporter family [Heracleum sosnowskyi]